jgi:hypothetical protein
MLPIGAIVSEQGLAFLQEQRLAKGDEPDYRKWSAACFNPQWPNFIFGGAWV